VPVLAVSKGKENERDAANHNCELCHKPQPVICSQFYASQYVNVAYTSRMVGLSGRVF